MVIIITGDPKTFAVQFRIHLIRSAVAVSGITPLP